MLLVGNINQTAKQTADINRRNARKWMHPRFNDPYIRRYTHPLRPAEPYGLCVAGDRDGDRNTTNHDIHLVLN